MAVTHSRSTERAAVRQLADQRASWRVRELCALLVASVLVGGRTVSGPPCEGRRGCAEIEAGLTAKRLLNLNDLAAREDLLPALTPLFPKMRDRDERGAQIYYLTGGLPNVGAIAHKKLLTGEQFRELKPLLVVRRPASSSAPSTCGAGLFFGGLSGWCTSAGACAASAATRLFLPALLLFSGIGLILMVSLRDPVRDNLLFVDFAQGAAAGAVLLARAQLRSTTSASPAS